MSIKSNRNFRRTKDTFEKLFYVLKSVREEDHADKKLEPHLSSFIKFLAKVLKKILAAFSSHLVRQLDPNVLKLP